jgi:hypothetical protein
VIAMHREQALSPSDHDAWVAGPAASGLRGLGSTGLPLRVAWRDVYSYRDRCRKHQASSWKIEEVGTELDHRR